MMQISDDQRPLSRGDDVFQDADSTPERATSAPDHSGRVLSKRSKALLLSLATVIVAGLIVSSLRYLSTGRYQQETNDADVTADVATVSPRIAGYVSAIFVADNQDVGAGQALIRVDAGAANARARQADAQISAAIAHAEAVSAQIKEQSGAVEQAQAQFAAAQARQTYDAAEVLRYRPLVAAGAETVQQLAQAELAATQSREGMQTERAQLGIQQRRIATLRAQLQEATAQIESARAQRASANVDVGASIVRAAINGRIGDKTVTLGQYVQAGTRMMSIVPLDKLYVTANFKETQLALMRPGQPAMVSVDALGGMKLHGRIESLSPGTGSQFSILPPQNATGNFTKITQRVPVRIAINPTPAARLLVPGLSVSVSVDTSAAKSAVR